MDPLENPVFAAPSVENGNMPLDTPSQPETPAPQEAPTPAQPVAPEVPVTEQPPVAQPTATPEGELHELPDGRKVDAATLAREWKENFLPDYTRKSQIIAAQRQQGQPAIIDNNPQQPANPYADPNYIPKNYEEIIAVAEARAVQRIEETRTAEQQRVQAIEGQVTTQLNEIRATDPQLNENALFLHATKYGFQDLKAAHANMKDMNAMVKTVQQQTATNMQRRANEPVATQPGQSTGAKSDPSHFENARDYLQSLQK